MSPPVCLVLAALAVGVASSHLRADKTDPAKPPPKKPTITGAITFKDKPTFAKGTEVSIQVRDVSRAGAKAIVLGSKMIKGPKKAPIPFEVEYDDSKIKPSDRISLHVRITLDKKLLYINDTNIPVINAPGVAKGVKAPVIAVKRAGKP